MKLKRVILKTLWVIFSLFVGLVLWVILWWFEKPAISVDYVAQLNEMRKPADYRPEDDGADLFLKACSMAIEFDGDDRLISRSSAVWPGDMNDVEIGLVKAWVASNEPAIATLEQAMAKPYFWLRRESTGGGIYGILYTELNGFKNLARAQICRGKLKAWQGDVTGGLGDIFMAGNMGKCFGDKPVLLELIIGTAIANLSRVACLDLISHADLSSSELAQAAAGIETMAARWQLSDSVLGAERLAFLDAVQSSFGSSGRLLPKPLYDEERVACRDLRPGQFFHGSLSRLTPELWGGVTESHLSRWRTLRKAMVFAWRSQRRDPTVRRYDESSKTLLSWIDADPARLMAAGTGSTGILTVPVDQGSFAEPHLRSVANVAWQYHRLQSDCAGTVGVIAILRYKSDKGALPDGWEDVVKAGYLKEVPMDRFAIDAGGGALPIPFAYTRTADNFAVSGAPHSQPVVGKPIIFWPVEKITIPPSPTPGPN